MNVNYVSTLWVSNVEEAFAKAHAEAFEFFGNNDYEIWMLDVRPHKTFNGHIKTYEVQLTVERRYD